MLKLRCEVMHTGNHILSAYAADCGLAMINDDLLQKLDILNYAFGVVEGTDIVFKHPEDLDKLKSIKLKYPNLKIILSVGGGGGGKLMTAAVETEEKFGRLVESIFSAMQNNGFDGIDIDWEYPTTTGHPEERQKHTALLKALRERLDGCGTKKYLSVAAPDGNWAFQITELAESHVYLDYINAMTYDMTDFKFTSHHTAPYSSNGGASFFARSVQNTINVYKKYEVPLEKLIVGAAFYSKKWDNIKGGQNGLGVPVEVCADYGPTITGLKKDYINKNGYVRYWDETAKAPYLYNGSTFITYDDEESISIKCDMIRENKVGGIMMWEIAGDRDRVIVPLMRECLDKG